MCHQPVPSGVNIVDLQYQASTISESIRYKSDNSNILYASVLSFCYLNDIDIILQTDFCITKCYKRGKEKKRKRCVSR